MGQKKRELSVAKHERRQQILLAWRDVFVKRGYHQTTIDDIVAEAGVARGTFYLYFDDKRAVFAELIERFSPQITMAIIRITTDDSARSVSHKVRDNIRAIIGVPPAERPMTKIPFTDAVGIDADFPRKLAIFHDTV